MSIYYGEHETVYIIDHKDFTTRYARGTEFADEDDLLICRAMAANQNHHASGRFAAKATSPAELRFLSDRRLQIGQEGRSLSAPRDSEVNSSV